MTFFVFGGETANAIDQCKIFNGNFDDFRLDIVALVPFVNTLPKDAKYYFIKFLDAMGLTLKSNGINNIDFSTINSNGHREAH